MTEEWMELTTTQQKTKKMSSGMVLALVLALIVVSVQAISMVLEWQDHQRESHVSRIVDE